MTSPKYLCMTNLTGLSNIFVCISKIQQTWYVSPIYVFKKRPVMVSDNAQNNCVWNFWIFFFSQIGKLLDYEGELGDKYFLHI